jgi:hypothetical protein
MFNPTIILTSTLLLSGCASPIGSFFNRPVVEDNVANVLSTVSLSADRRTVVVLHPQPSGQKAKFCAEPPPDTASGLKTDLDSNVSYQGGTVGIKDKFETSVTVLAARNAPLDAFRTGVFTLCQFYIIGALKEDEIGPLFKQLMVTYENTQGKVPALASAAAPLAKVEPEVKK